MNAKYVNIGLHASQFARLPAKGEYEQLKALCQRGVYTCFAFNIEKALDLLAQFPLATLHISVPTLGFTDPAMDYSLEPQFAVPISLRGGVAQNNGAHLMPMILAKDIAGNEYPLLSAPLGNIDYRLIEANSPDNNSKFSTLDALTYCYRHEQLFNNQQLIAINQVLSNEMEVILPRDAPSFDFQISVVNENKIISSETIHFKNAKTPFSPTLLALWQEKRANNNLHLHYKLTQRERSLALSRLCLTFEVPYPKDIEFYYENELIPRQGANSLQIKQYFGLSKETLRYVISSVVSVYLFQSNRFINGVKQPNQSTFNDFDKNPATKKILYKKLIEGVLNRSVPLYALSPYFASFDEVKVNLEKINVNELEEHDCIVFEKLYQRLLENEQDITPFVEELDQMLSEPLNETTVALETKGRLLNVDDLVIKASAFVETQTGEKLKFALTEKLHVLRKDRQLALVSSPSAPTNEKGAVYKINLKSLQKVKVIEDFDWQANDKINLTDLIDALGASRGGSTVVHASINENGDTEIWVEHHVPDNQAQQYHIATLKGLKNLPGDLNKYIEVR